MGGSQSLPLETVEGFTPEEVARLHKRFRKLDKDSNESLCVEEFLALPELKENPLVQRVVSVFDTNNSGELDFIEFVRGLAMFTTKNVDREKKLKFLFSIYDTDRDGFIRNSELFEVRISISINQRNSVIDDLPGAQDDGWNKPNRDPATADR